MPKDIIRKPETIMCSKCGKDVKYGTKKCPSCGNIIITPKY